LKKGNEKQAKTENVKTIKAMNKNKASGLVLACTDLYGIHLIKYDLENENRSPCETRVTVIVDFTAVTILVSKTENRHGFRADQFDLQHPSPSPARPALQLLKVGSFKFPTLGAKKLFKCPTNR